MNGKWIIAKDGRPYYVEHGKKLALVGYVDAGEAEGSAEDALVDVLRRLVWAEADVDSLRAQIVDETRTTDELLDKLMDGEGELREHLRTLGAIVSDLADSDPHDYICTDSHADEVEDHAKECVWRRAREVTTKVASR